MFRHALAGEFISQFVSLCEFNPMSHFVNLYVFNIVDNKPFDQNVYGSTIYHVKKLTQLGVALHNVHCSEAGIAWAE
jgi:hypothetical protein